MKSACQLFQEIPADFGAEILCYLRDEVRDIYKSSVASLAVQRKLRPVFVQRKPVKDQVAWLHKSLKLKTSDNIGEHILQVWLLKGNQDMLISFLNDMGIEHDGEGAVEDLPDSLDETKLKTAVDNLLGAFERRKVSLYLHVFQMQTPDGWPELGKMLEEDARLTFQDEPVAATPPESEPSASTKSDSIDSEETTDKDSGG